MISVNTVVITATRCNTVTFRRVKWADAIFRSFSFGVENFLVSKFCGKAQLPHSFGQFFGNYAENVPFHKICTPNYGILRMNNFEKFENLRFKNFPRIQTRTKRKRARITMSFFENFFKKPWLGKKCLDCFHLWLDFSIQTQF